MWQEILILMIAITALVYLGKRFFGKPDKTPGCDKCGNP